MNIGTKVTLNNGYAMSLLGFGTWQTPNGQIAIDAVKAAIEIGYRHILTSGLNILIYT